MGSQILPTAKDNKKELAESASLFTKNPTLENPTKDSVNKQAPVATVSDRSVCSDTSSKRSRDKRQISKHIDPLASLRSKHTLFGWLLNGIKHKRIKLNHSGAPVHIVSNHVALISPKIFDLYLDDNKAEALSYGKSRDHQLAQLQRSIKDLALHNRTNGVDFQRIIIRGPRRESAMAAILIPRDQFPELDNYSENPILQWGELKNSK